MALTKISTGGVKDDAASQAKIADEAIDEARLQVSNAGSNGQFLQKQSGNTGGLTWATATTDTSDKASLSGCNFTGSVGINTSSPVRKLHVTADDTPVARFERDTSDGAIIEIRDTSNNTIASIGSESGDLEISAENSNNLRFAVGTSEKFRVGSSGQLGIGGATYGSSGQVLTSGGASAAPSWAAAGGGIDFDSQSNLVGGTNAGDSFTGTDAENNILLGSNAGTAITTGDDHVCMGKDAGSSITTSTRNILIGNEAGKNLTAHGVIALGKEAAKNISSDNNSIAIGFQALTSNTTGPLNLAIGSSALSTVNGTWSNIAVGVRNLKFCTGGQNCSFGQDTAQGHTSGSYNTYLGHSCGPQDATNGAGTGNFNTTVGTYSLRGGGGAALSGASNSFLGYYAGHDVTSGSNNSGIGEKAGYNVTTGSNNLLLGHDAGTSNSASGNITTSSNIICLGDSSITDIYAEDTSISSSDKRDKTDITDFTNGLNWINQLKPVTYRWDKRRWYDNNTPDGSKKRNRKHLGFLAQDVLAIEGNPTNKNDMLVVSLNEDDTAYGLKYERLVPVLVNAIKELSAKVEALEAK